ncbi:hypothetical protein DFJ63DRAFT_332465 [Scheffersomyces coipomensis]|uniref:uncharacterized protein n=1 Tax=Scheffersomyces coipomensis TaxID=1788519 RepID=UPI00315CA135
MDISNLSADFGYTTTALDPSRSSISSISNSSPPTPIALPRQEPSFSTIYQNLLTSLTYSSSSTTSIPSPTHNDKSIISLHQHANGSRSRLLMTESGDLRFYGKTSPISFLNECRNYFASSVGTSKFSKIPSQETLQRQQQQMLITDGISDPRSISIPDEETCDMLINIFQENINNVYYVFDMEYFKQTIFRPVFNNDDTLDPLIKDKLLCLEYMVFAISTLFIKFKDANQLTHLNLLQPQQYLQACETLLQNHPHKHDDKLWIAEYHLLTYFYYISCCNKGSSWIHLGISIRICQALGLYDNKTNNQFANVNYSLHRKKIWRSIFICDRICSITFGRPLTINVDHGPRLINGKVDDLQDQFQYNLYLISSINGSIIEKIYRDDESISIPVLNQLCQDLNDWYLNLSPQLKLNWDNPDDFTNISKVFLHLNYLFGIINLGRPIFMNFINSPTLTHTNDMVIHFMKLTIKASYLSLHLIKSYLSSKPDRNENFLLITVGLYSSLILGVTTLNQRQLVKFDDEYIRLLSEAIMIGKDVLASIGKYDKVSRHWSTVIGHSLDCLKQPLINQGGEESDSKTNGIDISYSLINIRFYEDETSFGWGSLPTPQISSSSYEFEDDGVSSFSEEYDDENLSDDETQVKGAEIEYMTLLQTNKITNACIQDLFTLTGYEGIVEDFSNKVNNEFINTVNTNITRAFGVSSESPTSPEIDHFGSLMSTTTNATLAEATKPTPGNDLEAFRYDFNEVS